MSAATGAADAFAVYLAKWDEAEPEQRLLRTFVAAARDPRAAALGCLEHELAEAAFVIREPGVAQAKLGWWLEEIDHARGGRPRHPLMRRLLDAGGAVLLEGSQLEGAVTGAAGVAGLESVAELGGLLRPVQQMVQPFAALRARLARRELPPPPALQALAAARVLAELAHFPRFAAAERGRIPLDALARHHVTRRELAEPEHAAGAARVLRTLAQALGAQLVAIDAYALGGIDGARAVVGRVRAQRLQSAAAAAATVGGRAPDLGWRLLWPLWRYARTTRAGAG